MKLPTVLGRVPVFGDRELAVDPSLGFRLVVNRIETDDSLEENVQFRMRSRVGGNLEERLEDVCDSQQE